MGGGWVGVRFYGYGGMAVLNNHTKVNGNSNSNSNSNSNNNNNNNNNNGEIRNKNPNIVARWLVTRNIQ